MATLDNKQIEDKVLKYEVFVNDVLKRDLKETHRHLDRINSEVADWIQLKSILNVLIDNDLMNGFKTQLDVGTNIYVQADIPDTSTILLNVGCGIYVQYQIKEALRFIEKQINLLEQQVKIIKKRTSEIKGRIKLVLYGIQELCDLK